MQWAKTLVPLVALVEVRVWMLPQTSPKIWNDFDLDQTEAAQMRIFGTQFDLDTSETEHYFRWQRTRSNQPFLLRSSWNSKHAAGIHRCLGIAIFSKYGWCNGEQIIWLDRSSNLSTFFAAWPNSERPSLQTTQSVFHQETTRCSAQFVIHNAAAGCRL